MSTAVSSLFRPEVLAARRDLWLGEAQLAQPLPIRIVTFVSVALTGAMIVYLIFGAYSRRVHADGILAPTAGLITIASPTAGRISAAAAREGDRVEKGQLLYTVDVDAVSADGPTQQRVLAELRKQVASVERQREVRASVATIEKQALLDQLANTHSQRDGMVREVAVQGALTESLRARAVQLKDALGNGIARASDVQNQNFYYIEANSQLAQFMQGKLQLDGKIAELGAKLAAFDSTVARDLAEMDRAIAQLRQQVAESEARHAIEIRAPEQGILTSPRVHVGQQVPAGSPLLTLLPSAGRLQANLYVDSAAIGFIAKGQPVMLRYAAFPFQRFGLYRGTVAEVTRAPVDAAEGARKSDGAGNGGQESLYRIIVAPDREFVLAYGAQRALQAGMRVEADIAIEKRPLYRWLLDPIDRLKRSADLVTQGASQ